MHNIFHLIFTQSFWLMSSTFMIPLLHSLSKNFNNFQELYIFSVTGVTFESKLKSKLTCSALVAFCFLNNQQLSHEWANKNGIEKSEREKELWSFTDEEHKRLHLHVWALLLWIYANFSFIIIYLFQVQSLTSLTRGFINLKKKSQMNEWLMISN